MYFTIIMFTRKIMKEIVFEYTRRSRELVQLLKINSHEKLKVIFLKNLFKIVK